MGGIVKFVAPTHTQAPDLPSAQLGASAIVPSTARPPARGAPLLFSGLIERLRNLLSFAIDGVLSSFLMRPLDYFG